MGVSVPAVLVTPAAAFAAGHLFALGHRPPLPSPPADLIHYPAAVLARASREGRAVVTVEAHTVDGPGERVRFQGAVDDDEAREVGQRLAGR